MSVQFWVSRNILANGTKMAVLFPGPLPKLPHEWPVVLKNTLATIMKTISEAARLNRRYTNYCLLVTAISVLSARGGRQGFLQCVPLQEPWKLDAILPRSWLRETVLYELQASWSWRAKDCFSSGVPVCSIPKALDITWIVWLWTRCSWFLVCCITRRDIDRRYCHSWACCK